MATDLATRRVLGAVRLLDWATGALVTAPLKVSAPGATWTQNRSGTWVLSALDGLASHAHEFTAPPSTPAARSITVTSVVTDPRRAWQPRAFTFKVPRPVGSGPNDLFTPQDVFLPPSPTTPVRATWAAVRLSVKFATDASHPVAVPIEGALVRMVTGGEVRCMSLTDERGEALVIGHSIPMFSAGDDETIIAPAQPHDLTIVVDPAATDADTGRRTTVADPDDLWARRASLRRVAKNNQPLAPGDERSLPITIPRS